MTHAELMYWYFRGVRDVMQNPIVTAFANVPCPEPTMEAWRLGIRDYKNGDAWVGTDFHIGEVRP